MTIPRYLLEKHFAGDLRMIRAMEDQSQAVTDGVAATSALQDATVIVLSPNGDFTNERVLEVGDGIKVEITDDTVKLSVQNVAMVNGYPVTLNANSPANLILPVGATLVAGEYPMFDVSTLGNYANDAAAAAGGVVVGQAYRNGSTFCVRVT
jgi:hypothetical protein